MTEKIESLTENTTNDSMIESDFTGLHKNLNQSEKIEFYEFRERLAQGIANPQEARHVLDKLRQYADPFITVSEKSIKEIDNNGSLEAHEGWIPGLKIIIGSIAVAPYEDTKNRFRKILRILPNVQIEPRFTGPDKAFHGTIAVKKDKLILGQDIEYLE